MYYHDFMHKPKHLCTYHSNSGLFVRAITFLNIGLKQNCEDFDYIILCRDPEYSGQDRTSKYRTARKMRGVSCMA